MTGARPRIRLGLAVWVAALLLESNALAATPIRAAYFYDYMTPGHVDSLSMVGFNRALVRMMADSVNSDQADRLSAFEARGRARGFTIVPDFLLQSRPRLQRLSSSRRYTWGRGNREPNIACPLDTNYWKSALFDHADEVLSALPTVRAFAVDLEIYDAGRKHYDAGACVCPACLAEYTGLPPGRARPEDAWKMSGLLAYQEARLARLLAVLTRRFAAEHPGVEFGVLDLDFDSFVHRALARALARAQIPVVDYTERSYRAGGGTLSAARARLSALGLAHARMVGGLWLKRWPPGQIPSGVRSVIQRADGYFVFTTYSLWLDPKHLSGPYSLQGAPSEYWRALREVNRQP